MKDENVVRIKIFDFVLWVSMIMSWLYMSNLWFEAQKHPEPFSFIGATFIILFSGLMITALKLFLTVAYDFLKPRLLKQFKKSFNIKMPQLFGRRIEISIRVVNNDTSKVTF